MERDPRSAGSILLRRFAAIVACLTILAGAVPASAVAWVGPPPAPATNRPAATAQPASRPGGQAIYETVTGAPAPDPLTVAAIKAERAAAAAAASPAAASEPAPTDAPRTSPARASTSTPKPALKTTPKKSAPTPTPKPAAPTYSGRDHMWFPALGISHSVIDYACSASYALSYSAVYRWGCAGANNVYLMAHAGGIFGPLYTAYYAGKLKVGMLVVYADGASHIHYFKLQWWKTTPPSGDVGWAYAAQPVSSLTLQTCVGADSSLRLVARFVEVAKP